MGIVLLQELQGLKPSDQATPFHWESSKTLRWGKNQTNKTLITLMLVPEACGSTGHLSHSYGSHHGKNFWQLGIGYAHMQSLEELILLKLF